MKKKTKRKRGWSGQLRLPPDSTPMKGLEIEEDVEGGREGLKTESTHILSP